MAEPKGFNVKKQYGFTTIAVLCFLLLYTPIILLVLYSFNAGTSIAIWEGFSWRWYVSAWDNEQVKAAALRSLWLAIVASAVATSVAVLAALATTRRAPYKGQTLVFAIINQPLMVPEIVTAVALLIFFALIKNYTGYTGGAYLFVAHSAFCVPFAYMPIRARLQGMDLTLEQAASDLYGTPLRVFRKVTLPLLWPGILAGAMLAFVISLDDVVITEFVKAAGQDTLPTYMLGQLRRVVTPEVNAISTVLLAISVTMVIVYFILNQRKN
ncbi:ABC transporter permease [Roseovarius sp. C7]|uniref:ABC transporter permease n=1 Tax=Roseovarius sp. C7 TaxID=3398643 RepID=UPI0039F65D62